MRSAYRPPSRRLLAAVLLAALSALIAWQAYRQWSQGDDFPQIAARASAGPYRLLVGTIPDRISVRPGHIAVDVRDAHTGLGVGTARVVVTAVGPGGRRLGPVRARDGGMDRQYYDAPVKFPAAGAWRVSVSVRGAAGSGRLTLPLTVAAPVFPWALMLRWLIPAGLLLAALGYTERERRRAVGITRGREPPITADATQGR